MGIVPRATERSFWLAFDPDFEPGPNDVKFRLTYEGRLEGNGSPKHKHEIRRAFHPQLRRLWAVSPTLSSWEHGIDPTGQNRKRVRYWEHLAHQNARFGYKFVPLGTERHGVIAAVDILFLRPNAPGSVIQSGDIDNRLKTLFDALKMPGFKEELGPYVNPEPDEDPFFVLLEDDRLISHVSVETDYLLQPTPTANGNFLPNDARLVVTVTFRQIENRASARFSYLS